MNKKNTTAAKQLIIQLINEGLKLTDSSMFEYCKCYTGNK